MLLIRLLKELRRYLQNNIKAFVRPFVGHINFQMESFETFAVHTCNIENMEMPLAKTEI